ncbi:hypothetical protein COV61_01590 [Candidatus Micrarchaeota archaeon CG11_big_fil_rev_8_21_14_0_20_47_5]|nr:MAG: hypothetical protein AUJ17_04865 [Candidatus Micrarchaeota archaeon CG1_02_47_40]PIN83953.1 MAG: hypothetical protein COV61_01590 [Candidatus Micrarchaeota archaeon CG11_big_fil_rev_8_21_14_0_20_47_5]
MYELTIVFLVSFVITLVCTPKLIRKFRSAGIVGKDVNKSAKPEIPEMGGTMVVMGLVGGVLSAVFLNTFFDFHFNLIFLLAALATILATALIGIFDDLFDMRQSVKAFLPLAAAIPLIAVKAAGSTSLFLPFFGDVELGVFYIVALIPIGVAVSSNLTNMLAGFNGMEAGMGIVIFAAVSAISLALGRVEPAILSLAMLGALLAFIPFNWNPAKIFMGDIGTLTIGSVLACAVITGNFESAGAILVIPYVIDFFIKALNRFPSSGWWGEERGGKLYSPDGKVRGFAQLVMKLSGGISEKKLVLVFIGMEALCVLAVLLSYSNALFGFRVFA